jgi:hypothetical protein
VDMDGNTIPTVRLDSVGLPRDTIFDEISHDAMLFCLLGTRFQLLF